MLPCELIPKLSDMPQFYGVALSLHRTDHTYPKKGMRAHIPVKGQLGGRRYWTGKRADAGVDPPVPIRTLHTPKPLLCKDRRSEERRVGKERVSKCRFRWSTFYYKTEKKHKCNTQ